MAEYGTADADESGTATRAERSGVITDAGFVKLAGGAELVAVGLVVVNLAVSITAGLPQPGPAPAEMGAWLSAVDAAGATYRATTWLFVADHLLEVAFVVALYYLLADAGGVMRVALVAGVVGLVVVALSGILQVGLAELAATYAGAGESARAGIVASAVALERVRLALNLLGTVLAWGVGGALFSAAILRTEVLPRWLGWLGLVFALVIWLNLLRLVSSAFEPLLLVMLLVGIVWLPSMGLSLLRIDPGKVPARP